MILIQCSYRRCLFISLSALCLLCVQVVAIYLFKTSTQNIVISTNLQSHVYFNQKPEDVSKHNTRSNTESSPTYSQTALYISRLPTYGGNETKHNNRDDKDLLTTRNHTMQPKNSKEFLDDETAFIQNSARMNIDHMNFDRMKDTDETNDDELILRLCPVSTVKHTAIKSQVPASTRCPVCGDGLRGREDVNYSNQAYKNLETMFSDFENGGHWSPKSCRATKKIAIIIPYRDRDRHLRTLLLNLVPKLQRQLADFTIYVVEQGGRNGFNRGLMRNIGFQQARRDYKYDCYIFNDVDTLIEDDRNLFTCRQNSALHLAVLLQRTGYTLLYRDLIGGVLGVTEEVFVKANGYTNFLFTWGGEDDNLARRFKTKNIRIVRPVARLTKVITFRHDPPPRTSPRRRIGRLVMLEPYADSDGLNSVKYTNIRVVKKKVFTWIKVQIDESYYDKLLKKYISQSEQSFSNLSQKTTSKEMGKFN